ncbi:MFS transporter [Chryseobacterium sp. SN22]|uniref:MFS transporter n=1 Tax=Chryseobacterium sp. SN22 TaxID=2606431 RepID=UPI0011ED43D3|nr:MFS transporter [Chryseobacterium sp. SN22]KAA0130643.1 MFS transporter [Chryseobacterium sp. SN22]
MNSRIAKMTVIYLLAFFTGLNFVIFPALSSVFTDHSLFGLSPAQFGNLFIPQVICIIASCIAAPFLVNKTGPKIILATGLVLMMAATAGLWSLQFFMNEKQMLFPALMILVACTGTGFGLSITTLNPLAASLSESNTSSSILILQFLVGLGTSASPLMINAVGSLQYWMYVPGIIFILIMLIFILFLSLRLEKGSLFQLPSHFKIPSRLWLFFAAIVLYGFIEGTFGSFGAVILKNQGLSSREASLGLSLFWCGIAVNRLLFGIFSKKFNLSYIFLGSPMTVAVLLSILWIYPNPGFLILMMFLTGFFMGTLFPGSIGWGTVEFPFLSVLVSGFLMAANQTGTGIITNTLGHFSNQTTLILQFLTSCMILIFILLMILRKNSKIEEAF